MQARLLLFLSPQPLGLTELNEENDDCQEKLPDTRSFSSPEAPLPPLEYNPAVALGEVTLGLARSIGELFQSVYGSRYHHRVLYDPEFVYSQIMSGRWIAFGIVSGTGELLAHAALLRTPSGEWKFARSVVHPAARGMGYGSKILDVAIAFARDYLKCRRLLSEAVTSHGITQTLFASRGFVPSAILLGKFIDYFNSGHRESTVLYTRHLCSPSPFRRPIFVCDLLEDLALRLREKVSAPLGLRIEERSPLQNGVTNANFIEGMDSVLLELSGPVPEAEVRQLLRSHQLGYDSSRGLAAPPPRYLEAAVNISDPSGIPLTKVCLELGLRPLGVAVYETADFMILAWGQEVSLNGLAKLNLEDHCARELASELREVWNYLERQCQGHCDHAGFIHLAP